MAALAAAALRQPIGWCVDLQACTVDEPGGNKYPFTIDAHDREQLLAGLDAIDLTWQYRSAIEAFESADRQRRPWIWAESSPIK